MASFVTRIPRSSTVDSSDSFNPNLDHKHSHLRPQPTVVMVDDGPDDDDTDVVCLDKPPTPRQKRNPKPQPDAPRSSTSSNTSAVSASSSLAPASSRFPDQISVPMEDEEKEMDNLRPYLSEWLRSCSPPSSSDILLLSNLIASRLSYQRSVLVHQLLLFLRRFASSSSSSWRSAFNQLLATAQEEMIVKYHGRFAIEPLVL
jgi:hypothetical protein